MSLKDILTESLWNQVEAAIKAHNDKETDKAKHCKLVDLSEGGYVSKEKYDNKTSALQSQIDALNSTITQRDTDLQSVRDQLKAAGADKTKLAETQTNLTNLQAQYDQAQKDWQAELAKQNYAFMVKEKAGELSFSSTSAKKAFIQDAIAKNFKVDGDVLLGYNDWLSEYKKTDPGAFVGVQGAGKPTITIPGNPGGGGSPKLTLMEQMQRANADPSYKPNFD